MKEFKVKDWTTAEEIIFREEDFLGCVATRAILEATDRYDKGHKVSVYPVYDNKESDALDFLRAYDAIMKFEERFK